MLKDINWRPLEQRLIDSHLIMLYKVTYDLVAILTTQYLTHNTRLSRHIHVHLLSCRQIPTLEDYYRFTLFPRSIFIGMPCQPVYQSFPPWHSSAVLFARWSMSLPKHQFLFSPFNSTYTLFTLYKLISPPFFYAFISASPLQHLVYRNLSDVSLGGWEVHVKEDGMGGRGR